MSRFITLVLCTVLASRGRLVNGFRQSIQSTFQKEVVSKSSSVVHALSSSDEEIAVRFMQKIESKGVIQTSEAGSDGGRPTFEWADGGQNYNADQWRMQFTPVPDFMKLLAAAESHFSSAEHESTGKYVKTVSSADGGHAVIIGDLHGQLFAVLPMLLDIKAQHPDYEMLEGSDILICDPRLQYVFLGDYVDRGQHDLEVVALTLSYKMLCPYVTLLKGNHEFELINFNYGFTRMATRFDLVSQLGPYSNPSVGELEEELNNLIDEVNEMRSRRVSRVIPHLRDMLRDILDYDEALLGSAVLQVAQKEEVQQRPPDGELRSVEGGCFLLGTEAECVASKDGRAETLDQPCQWCCGQPCTVDEEEGLPGALCEPRDWLSQQSSYKGYGHSGLGNATENNCQERNLAAGDPEQEGEYNETDDILQRGRHHDMVHSLVNDIIDNVVDKHVAEKDREEKERILELEKAAEAHRNAPEEEVVDIKRKAKVRKFQEILCDVKGQLESALQNPFYQAFKRVFDRLPYAAIVEETGLALHGGLHYQLTSLCGTTEAPDSPFRGDLEACVGFASHLEAGLHVAETSGCRADSYDTCKANAIGAPVHVGLEHIEVKRCRLLRQKYGRRPPPCFDTHEQWNEQWQKMGNMAIEGLFWSDPRPKSGWHASSRGAGQQFGPEEARGFLQNLGLKWLLRGHEQKAEGFEEISLVETGEMDGKYKLYAEHTDAPQTEYADDATSIFTIFSAADYCGTLGNAGNGQKNAGSYMIIDRNAAPTVHKLRDGQLRKMMFDLSQRENAVAARQAGWGSSMMQQEVKESAVDRVLQHLSNSVRTKRSLRNTESLWKQWMLNTSSVKLPDEGSEEVSSPESAAFESSVRKQLTGACEDPVQNGANSRERILLSQSLMMIDLLGEHPKSMASVTSIVQLDTTIVKVFADLGGAPMDERKLLFAIEMRKETQLHQHLLPLEDPLFMSPHGAQGALPSVVAVMAFTSIDKDDDNLISKAELLEAMEKAGSDQDDGLVEVLFEDKEPDAQISRQEFVQAISGRS